MTTRKPPQQHARAKTTTVALYVSNTYCSVFFQTVTLIGQQIKSHTSVLVPALFQTTQKHIIDGTIVHCSLLLTPISQSFAGCLGNSDEFLLLYFKKKYFCNKTTKLAPATCPSSFLRRKACKTHRNTKHRLSTASADRSSALHQIHFPHRPLLLNWE